MRQVRRVTTSYRAHTIGNDNPEVGGTCADKTTASSNDGGNSSSETLAIVVVLIVY